MAQPKAIILSSGGIDSTACIHFCKKEKIKPFPFFVDFGQVAAQKESKSINRICKHYKLKLKSVKYNSDKTFGGGEITGRNAFLLLSALLTFGKEFEIIALGIHRGTTYPDSSRIFVQLMQKTFNLYSDGTVRIYAPFLDWTKNDIWTYCLENRIPVGLTYSCELGRRQPCGKCLSCIDLERLNATKKF